MLGKTLKTVIITLIVLLAGAFSAFAADSFPFEIEFDVEEVGRLCYAGHRGDSVKYREGIAVTPDTWFTVTPVYNYNDKVKVGEADIAELSAEISLMYENDSLDGSYTEVLKTYEVGSLTEDGSFQLLSENNIANLKDRGKLYSDQLRGLSITFNARLGSRDKKKTIYLYVCDYEDLDYFYSNSYN